MGVVTLNNLIQAIKDFDMPLVGDLLNKKLRLCIDGKQIIEIESIELIPRMGNLTLNIKSSFIHGALEELKKVNQEAFENEILQKPNVEEPKVITQEEIVEAFKLKKENDGKSNT